MSRENKIVSRNKEYELLNGKMEKVFEEIRDLKVEDQKFRSFMENGFTSELYKHLGGFEKEVITATTKHGERIKGLNTRVTWLYGILGGAGFIGAISILVRIFLK